MSDSEVAICTLLPDVLGTYSDAGNATVLRQRLHWRGIPVRMVDCTADQEPPTSCDIYLLGGGEDTSQLFAAAWLRARPALCAALRDRACTLAICAGMQILGREMTDGEGRRHPGAAVLDLSTTPRRRRATGELVTEASDLPPLTGFENHRGGTTLGPGVRPLGHVVRGVGNGDRALGRRGTDGARTDHILATYMHGPVLARNPALADLMLTMATGATLTDLEVPDQRSLRATYLGRRAGS